MKKILIFMLFSGLVGLNNSFSQDVQTPTPFQKNKEALHRVNNQSKRDKSMRAEQPLTANEKSAMLWKPDTVLIYSTSGLDQRYSYTYDRNGNELTWLFEYIQSDAWEIAYRRTNTYDGNGNIVTYSYEDLVSGIWVNNGRKTFTYDGNGNMLTCLYEELEGGVWFSFDRETYTYDGSGNKLTWLYEECESGVWVAGSKETYTYDGSGNRLTELKEFWESGAWVPSYRVTCTYGANRKTSTALNESWESGAWVNSSYETYDYDANGNNLTYLIDNWQDTVWEKASRGTYTYDADGNKLTWLYERWSIDKWVESYRNTYTYDGQQGNSLTGMSEYWEGETWQPYQTMLELYANKIIFLFDFVAHRYEASFLSFTDGIADAQADNSIIVYPNPATNQVFVNVSDYTNTTVELYTVHGQLCQSLTLQVDKTEINMANLAKGLYLLKIKSPTKIQVRKFVKE